MLLPAAFLMLGWQKELSPYPRFCAARWPCRPLGRSTQHRFVLHRGSCSDSHLAEAKGHSTENHERTRVLGLLTPSLRSQYCPSQSQSRVGRQQQTAMPRCWRLRLKRSTQEQPSGPGFGRASQPYVNILPAPPCPVPVPQGKTLSHTCEENRGPQDHGTKPGWEVLAVCMYLQWNTQALKRKKENFT